MKKHTQKAVLHEVFEVAEHKYNIRFVIRGILSFETLY